jgi:UDP-N-acetylglucosamine 1-carboxyvinyltransferase
MSRFIIHGPRPLRGSITAAGNKNAALPMLAACLLTDQEVVLRNLPRIQDVLGLLEILAGLGVEVGLSGHTVRLRARAVGGGDPDPALCRCLRGSVLLAGPLLARRGEVTLPPPGGDVIGRRRLDTHFHGLTALGATVETSRAGFRVSARRLRGAEILLDEASVTATENIVMAAVRATGRTVLYNAACEPHVQDLCHLLNAMGARITGIGTNRLEVQGVRRLTGADHRIGPDYMEAASFLAAAAATGGAITVHGMFQPGVAEVVRRGFERLGAPFETRGSRWVQSAPADLAVRTDYGFAVAKLEDGIWPAFPSDLLSVMVVLATQARGSVLIFEKMFESRLYFVDRLIDMGAPIVQCDPHRVMVVGPARLSGATLTSPDIRAGMALIIAALCAKGTSVIENAQMIDRGYERIDARLRDLGADITRED